VIVADQLQPDGAERFRRNLAAALDDDRETVAGERTKSGRQRVGARGSDADPENAGKLARQPRHPALFPAGPCREHDLRQPLHDARPVVADDGHNQRCRHSLLRVDL
jgi:hypothetical protein